MIVGWLVIDLGLLVGLVLLAVRANETSRGDGEADGLRGALWLAVALGLAATAYAVLRGINALFVGSRLVHATARAEAATDAMHYTVVGAAAAAAALVVLVVMNRRARRGALPAAKLR